MTQSNIPIFSNLYEELEPTQLPDSLHCERLEQRSGFHDWKIKPHRHDQLVQLFVVLEGGGEAIIDGEAIKFVAPFVAYVPSLTVHSFHYIEDSSGFVLSVFKDEVHSSLQSVPNLVSLFNQSFSISENDNTRQIAKILDLMTRFHDEYRSNRACRLLALRSLLALILVNLSRCVPQLNEQPSETDFDNQQKVATLMEVIEANYTEHHSTEFYANAMNITLTKLRRMTQSILGISAHQLINNKIILEAKRNILYTSMTASQIADMLGFKDPAYFSRFFKKHTGESPSEYRKRASISENL
ncbi:helix-turn-helix domain-containing protein [Arenicella xantha]|uniref:AraC family transcriptional regulator n=1 Tax=Arenicella xantha TaxID=644221 RepID=A0A395JKK5_9GAMM|nr:helix-turn-helix domain-containing protein [Arenicella xantha]RBP47167.1 AraC family transcriptional regulator [Arenicella xantha]